MNIIRQSIRQPQHRGRRKAAKRQICYWKTPVGWGVGVEEPKDSRRRKDPERDDEERGWMVGQLFTQMLSFIHPLVILTSVNLLQLGSPDPSHKMDIKL